jgi:hypothetical protein
MWRKQEQRKNAARDDRGSVQLVIRIWIETSAGVCENLFWAKYYVEPEDYRYYFREGFRRGYEDGYNDQYQYGYYSNGSYGVLGNVLSLILNLQSLR